MVSILFQSWLLPLLRPTAVGRPSPLPDEHDEKLFEKFMDMAGAVLMGNGLGGLIQGTAGGLLFLFLGFNSPFLLWP